MIYLVTRLDNEAPARRFLHGLRKEQKIARALTYEQLFHQRRAPIGHYIFADHDRLSTYEREVAIAVASTLRNADPSIQILNHPGEVLERFPLLRLLEKAGLNQFSITRLDDGTRPENYPVFVRCEDHHLGNDTGLLYSKEELEQALEELSMQGKVLKRRVAVQFCAQRTQAGYYRKYGAINFNGTIIPQHIIDSDVWVAKSSSRKRNEAIAAEELEFIRENPHRDYLAKIFKMANIDYGRADYGIVDGKIQIYEINTNPTLPRLDREFHRDERNPKIIELRQQRRQLIRRAALDALESLDLPLQTRSPVKLLLPERQYHQLPIYRPMRVGFGRLRTSFRKKCSQILEDWEERNPELAKKMPCRSWMRWLHKKINW